MKNRVITQKLLRYLNIECHALTHELIDRIQDALFLFQVWPSSKFGVNVKVVSHLLFNFFKLGEEFQHFQVHLNPHFKKPSRACADPQKTLLLIVRGGVYDLLRVLPEGLQAIRDLPKRLPRASA